MVYITAAVNCKNREAGTSKYTQNAAVIIPNEVYIYHTAVTYNSNVGWHIRVGLQAAIIVLT